MVHDPGVDSGDSSLTPTEPTVSDSVTLQSRSTQWWRWISGSVAAVLVVVLSFLGTPYSIDFPGPAFNTLADQNGTPIIEVTGEETYPTSGQLDLTTVMVGGPPISVSPVFDVMQAWWKPEITAVPAEMLYPHGTTGSQVQEENTLAMSTSQESSVAAALDYLDIDFIQYLSVSGFVDDAPAEKHLRAGDEVLRAGGEDITGIEGLREEVNNTEGEDLAMTVRRDGEELHYEVPVTENEEDGGWQVGILLASSFEFPFDVEIGLQDVGGASAGMMFALGLIDKLTEESLADGRHIAGTGTIDPDGTVGPIGGIVQKVHGAHEEGAQLFLAPTLNCSELDGNVPEGMTVYAVDELADAVKILETTAQNASTQDFATCG